MKLASHNSLSYATPTKWYTKLINFTAQCQNIDVVSQYEKGVRLFDIRIKRDDWSTEFLHGTKPAHGIVEYDIDPASQLYELSRLATEEDPVYIMLSIENDKDFEDFAWFKRVYDTCKEDFDKLIFCGGYAKHPWRQIIFEDNTPTIEHKYWEFLNFTYTDTTKWGKIKLFFKNLFHFKPKYWAKKNNKQYIKEGTDKDFLMLDFVHYGQE